MTLAASFPGDVIVQGSLTVIGTPQALTRAQLTQSDNDEFGIPHTDWRVWDAMQTNLPGTAATDDLAIVGGTFGTASPAIQAGDLKAAGATTRYARCLFQLPNCYVAGQSVTIRAHCGMVTTVADTSCTIDFQAYRSDEETGIGSDLVTTAATTMNSLTDADKDFVLSVATLNPGDTLDIRMAIACTDAATGTAVIPSVGAVTILCDVKG